MCDNAAVSDARCPKNIMPTTEVILPDPGLSSVWTKNIICFC